MPITSYPWVCDLSSLKRILWTYPNLVQSIMDSLYVDDLIAGIDCVQGLTLNQSTNCYLKLHLIIHWFGRVSLVLNLKYQSYIFGITWNSQSNEFLFCFSELIEYAQGLPVTKRLLLRLLAKIIDPLCLISLFTIKLKIVFQTQCVKGKALEWNCFMSEARALSQLRVLHCYFAELQSYSGSITWISDASE